LRRTLVTVFAERSTSETRIISGRRATRHERRRDDMKKAKKRSAREPSAASLREIPEVDFSRVKVRRNPYAARIAREGIVVQVGRGRPKRLLEVGGTRPRRFGSRTKYGSRSRRRRRPGALPCTRPCVRRSSYGCGARPECSRCSGPPAQRHL